MNGIPVSFQRVARTEMGGVSGVVRVRGAVCVGSVHTARRVMWDQTVRFLSSFCKKNKINAKRLEWGGGGDP